MQMMQMRIEKDGVTREVYMNKAGVQVFRMANALGTAVFCPALTELGIHSRTPLYGLGERPRAACEFLNGDNCYYDGTSMGASALRSRVDRDGSFEAVWETLGDYLARLKPE